MPKKQYITNASEAQAVDMVRKGYFDTFAADVARWAAITDQSVLADVPCGTGGMTARLRQMGLVKQAYLIDINGAMIEAARQAVLERAEYITADASQLATVVPGGMNAIICLNGLHIYIEDKAAFLNGCRTVLASGGRLVFDVSTVGLNDDSRHYVDRHAELMRQKAAALGSVAHLPVDADQALLDSYVALGEASGLRLVECQYVEAVVPLERYNRSTVQIPGRLRPRLPGLDDDTRLQVFLSASQQAQAETGISAVKHSRVFYVFQKD